MSADAPSSHPREPRDLFLDLVGGRVTSVSFASRRIARVYVETETGRTVLILTPDDIKRERS